MSVKDANISIDYLWNKKDPYTEEELAVVKQHWKKDSMRMLYAYWKQRRRNGAYFFFGYDFMPFCPRKSAVQRSLHEIHRRELSDAEYNEVCQNFGLRNRRFYAWNFKHLKDIVEGDSLYGIDTPKSVIERYETLERLNNFKTEQNDKTNFRQSSV